MSSGVQLHVTLRHPMAIKINGEPRFARCFDATHEDAAGDPPATVFRTVKIWAIAQKGTDEYHIVPYKMALNLTVPVDNIAGVVSQPFDK